MAVGGSDKSVLEWVDALFRLQVKPLAKVGRTYFGYIHFSCAVSSRLFKRRSSRIGMVGRSQSYKPRPVQ